jgi:hypothetical protein
LGRIHLKKKTKISTFFMTMPVGCYNHAALHDVLGKRTEKFSFGELERQAGLAHSSGSNHAYVDSSCFHNIANEPIQTAEQKDRAASTKKRNQTTAEQFYLTRGAGEYIVDGKPVRSVRCWRAYKWRKTCFAAIRTRKPRGFWLEKQTKPWCVDEHDGIAR